MSSCPSSRVGDLMPTAKIVWSSDGTKDKAYAQGNTSISKLDGWQLECLSCGSYIDAFSIDFMIMTAIYCDQT